MTTKISGKPMWGKSPSGGKMIYGKEVKDDIKKGYQEKNLNEDVEVKIT